MRQITFNFLIYTLLLLCGFVTWGNPRETQTPTVRADPHFNTPRIIPKIKMTLVPIKSGSFMMGSTTGEKDEQPIHKVHITHPFWIGKYEVSQKEYDAIMDMNPSFNRNPKKPVSNVNWFQAVEFCNRLNSKKFAAKKVPSLYIYRLPTEAEWEYCCGAGTMSEFNFGNDTSIFHKYANFCDVSNTNKLPWQDKTQNDGFNKLAPVGSFLPNSWGIYDIHGNVWEWCIDNFGQYTRGVQENPCGAKNGYTKVLRGGSWYHAAIGCRTANRDGIDPSSNDKDFGFRIVLAPDYTNTCFSEQSSSPSDSRPQLIE